MRTSITHLFSEASEPILHVKIITLMNTPNNVIDRWDSKVSTYLNLINLHLTREIRSRNGKQNN